jgi:Serine carboxypeptidase S28
MPPFTTREIVKKPGTRRKWLHGSSSAVFRGRTGLHTGRSVVLVLILQQLLLSGQFFYQHIFKVSHDFIRPSAAWFVAAGIPAPEFFFENQLVDHFASRDQETDEDAMLVHAKHVWNQRYYFSDQFWKGPGYPIFIIIGGEGNVEPSTGFFYPFVARDLARRFGAAVLQPEHRFYGKSQPITRDEIDQAHKNGTPDPRLQLLTCQQALADMVRLLQYVKRSRLHGCSDDRSNPMGHYCPVITVGGSYPGFLSAMARVVYPQVIDMAYAASAPMLFYAQKISSSNDYYDHISNVLDQVTPKCQDAVRGTLSQVIQHIRSSPEPWKNDTMMDRLGICPSTVPRYITSMSAFVDELTMILGYTFANANMAYYPPTNRTSLGRACTVFMTQSRQDQHLRAASDDDIDTAYRKVRAFLVDNLSSSAATSTIDTTSLKSQLPSSSSCFNVSNQLPSGSNATISSGDWSGVGTGQSGESWDFQTCSTLIEAISFSPQSIFSAAARIWTLTWLEQHCRRRFGSFVVPSPTKLVQEWEFEPSQLVANNVSHILFTNGLRDGWSVSGIKSNLSSTLLALNFPTGAHHSDLSSHGPLPDNQDTADIAAGFVAITGILEKWLGELSSLPSSILELQDLR